MFAQALETRKKTTVQNPGSLEEAVLPILPESEDNAYLKRYTEKCVQHLECKLLTMFCF